MRERACMRKWVGAVVEAEGDADFPLSRELNTVSTPGPWDHIMSRSRKAKPEKHNQKNKHAEINI